MDDTYTVIIHPSKSANKLSTSDSPAKPLWRKRETVRQERTVHYTTIDASGEQQVCFIALCFTCVCHTENFT